jgi:beta-galactosidase
MHFLLVLNVCFAFLSYVITSPITYEDVRGTPYKVGYDHRAITINGQRTMLISGVIHYPRSTPGMWPYLFKMAKNQGLNAVQTYVFWNIHEQKQGVLDFSGRANLSKYLQDAADAGLFVNLRIGPYVCAEWDYGGLPAWLNQVPNIEYRSSNPAWEDAMKKFTLEIIDYVNPYLAKNGGPIILAQIENEYGGSDQAYVDWCGSLVSNELASTELVWIMCNGHAANSTIETCNSCNCLDDGWMDHHRQSSPDTPMLFTENEGWFQQWGDAVAIRTTSDLAYSVAEWYAAGGAYHAYYMWHGGNNYGNTAGSGITTMYADDVCLHADGTPNEPKYTQLSRLQHFVADHAQLLLGQDPVRTTLPWWDGKQFSNGTQQYVYSYGPPSLHFLGNQANIPILTQFRNQNITMPSYSLRIYDDNLNIIWDSANYSDIDSDNTKLFPVVMGPLEWKTWSEPVVSNLPVITSPNPIEQLKITNDETIYLWYRRNITLTQTQSHTIVRVETRKANALLFFLDGQYLGEIDNHDHSQGGYTAIVALDLSTFKPNQQYLFEILSISLGIDNGVWAGGFEYKGIVGNVWINDQLIMNDTSNVWEHQKGLVGEYFQIYTEQGSSKVDWSSEWTKGIDKPITWFQARFDLDHLVKEDTNANPVLLDAEGLNRGHPFINGNDLGLYWLIEGVCHESACCCQQAQINCMEPTQRYYHIPSDWLMAKNNLITIFDDLGAPSPGSVSLVQRVIIV